MEPIEHAIQHGCPIEYDSSNIIDCRSSFGNALVDLVEANKSKAAPIAVIDCDLAASVKTEKIAGISPESFIQCGIQEHNAVSVAGALSKAGILTFVAGFGVFGIDETYGQHRMIDFNNTSLKLICTHCGLDVREDGKTHQCIDYISLVTELLQS